MGQAPGQLGPEVFFCMKEKNPQGSTTLLLQDSINIFMMLPKKR